jgi:hypothetical protein
LAVYLYLKKQWFLVGIFVGIGTLIEIYPLFLLYLIGIVCIAKRKYKELFLLGAGFVISFLTITISYFGLNIPSILQLFLVHFERNTSFSFENMFLLSTNLPNGNFTIDPFSIIAVSEIAIFGLLLYRYIRKNADWIDAITELKLLFFFFLLLPVFLLDIFFRYFLWSLPMFVTFLKVDVNLKEIKKFLIVDFILLIFLLITFEIFIPGNILNNLSNLEPIFGSNYYNKYFLLYTFIAFSFFIMLVVNSIIWWKKIIFQNKIKRSNSSFYKILIVICIVAIFYSALRMGYWATVILGGVFYDIGYSSVFALLCAGICLILLTIPIFIKSIIMTSKLKNKF